MLYGPDLAGRVVRGGLYRVIGFGVVNLLGIASTIVLLHHLGVDDFGRYGTVIALVGIASGLADAGLNMTGSRELALLPAGPGRQRLLGALLGVRLLLLTTAAIAALLFALAVGYDSTMVVGTALAAVGAVLIGAQSTLTLPLVVDLRNALMSINEVLKQVILVAAVVVFAAAGASLTPFFAVQIMVYAGAVMVLFIFIIALLNPAEEDRPRFDVHAIVGLLAAALMTVITAVLARAWPNFPHAFRPASGRGPARPAPGRSAPT